MIIKMQNDIVVRNSLKAWFLAARPKTLAGAAVPVMLGSAYAWHEMLYASPGQSWEQVIEGFGWLPMTLCFLFAFVMQIDANFVNDYFDCVKGKDNEKRLGPERACQQGWVTLPAMRWAIVLTTMLACAVGLPLIYFGGWEMVAVGLLCVVFCFLYTTLMASIGMGDILVLVFFGIVPVCCTWWVIVPHEVEIQHGFIPVMKEGFFDIVPTLRFLAPFLLSFACGLVVDTLLIVNNYRDIDNDREVGKKTLVVLLGKKTTEYLYVSLPAVAIVIVLCLFGWSALNMILCFGVYFLYTGTWNEMKTISQGRLLNKVLGKTARNIFVFGILITLLVILQ